MIRRTCAVALSGVALALSAQVSLAQSVDDLIAKNVAAKGGLQKMRSIQTIRQTSRMSMQGVEADVTMVAKRPNLMRQDISVGGMQMVNAYDGQTVWAINPVTGSSTPAASTGPDADILKEQSSFDGPLVDYKARGATVALVSTDNVGGRALHRLKVTAKSGSSQEIYLDAETGLEARVVINTPGGTMAQELSDYRDVDGMKVPFTIRMLINDMPLGEIKVTNVEFNVPIDDKVFRMGGE